MLNAPAYQLISRGLEDASGQGDKISHEWLIQFVEHRIQDKRIVRLIQKWLKAGVMEQGRWFETEEGTPQGAVISPILANLYLHYVLDVWVKVWRQKSTGRPPIEAINQRLNALYSSQESLCNKDRTNHRMTVHRSRVSFALRLERSRSSARRKKLFDGLKLPSGL